MTTTEGFAKRRELGRMKNAPAPTRHRWRELDAMHEKRETEPENWPFQCFCGYRYDTKALLLRHAAHANKYSQIEGLHRPYISRLRGRNGR